MILKLFKNIYNNGIKLYGEIFLQQNGKNDLMTRFVKGAAPVIIGGYFYYMHRRQIPDLDPTLNQYYDLEVDKQNTPNFSEQRLKQLQTYSVVRQRIKK